MPTLIVPNSFGSLTALAEFNTCHAPGGTAVGGEFCSKTGTSGATRPTPIRTRSIDQAVELLLQGKVVELMTTRSVNTLIHRLADMALDAKAKGKEAPNYDLCNVSAPGTNMLFCGSKLRTKEYPNGIPRTEMPQFVGTPEPGSPADKLPKKKTGNVDAADAFREYLTSIGIRASAGIMPASKLKASQRELVGAKVASMMTNSKYDPGEVPIFVSRDGYVIDGHHRWAAVVGRDASDGKLGGLKVRVIRVNAPISEIIKIAKKWTKRFGIQSRGFVELRPLVTKRSWVMVRGM